MKKVKKIFFLEEQEAEELQKKEKFSWSNVIKFPCFELEDGTIMYPHYGCPAGGEIWWDILQTKY